MWLTYLYLTSTDKPLQTLPIQPPVCSSGTLEHFPVSVHQLLEQEFPKSLLFDFWECVMICFEWKENCSSLGQTVYSLPLTTHSSLFLCEFYADRIYIFYRRSYFLNVHFPLSNMVSFIKIIPRGCEELVCCGDGPLQKHKRLVTSTSFQLVQ